VEAGIAALHAAAGRAEETRWDEIVRHYDVLMRIRPSPVVALNRAVAVAQHEGPERGLQAIRAIEDADRLAHCPFYAAAMGELERRAGRAERARSHFVEAHRLARNEGERRFLEQRVAACTSAQRDFRRRRLVYADASRADAGTRPADGRARQGDWCTRQ